jgi:hypothetical protein
VLLTRQSTPSGVDAGVRLSATSGGSLIFAARHGTNGDGKPFFTSPLFYRAFTQDLNHLLVRGVSD